MLFLFINVGSFAASVCTAVEQRYGFALAFSIPTVVFMLGFGVFMAGKRHYVHNAPEKSVLVGAWRRFLAASSHKVSHSHSQSEAEEEETTQSDLSDGSSLGDLKRALYASSIFLLYSLFWAACSQLTTNFVSQAATMKTRGVPNDLLLFLDPIGNTYLAYLRPHYCPLFPTAWFPS
jgi:POT family proton-dependent oligopeptide transporter